MMRSIYPGSKKKPSPSVNTYRNSICTPPGWVKSFIWACPIPTQWRQWTGCARMLDGVSQHQVSETYPWTLPANEPGLPPVRWRKAGNRNQGKILGSSGSGCSDGADQADYMVAEKAVKLIRERKEAGKPFFMGVGFFRPTTRWWHRKSFSICIHWKR